MAWREIVVKFVHCFKGLSYGFNIKKYTLIDLKVTNYYFSLFYRSLFLTSAINFINFNKILNLFHEYNV